MVLAWKSIVLYKKFLLKQLHHSWYTSPSLFLVWLLIASFSSWFSLSSSSLVRANLSSRHAPFSLSFQTFTIFLSSTDSSSWYFAPTFVVDFPSDRFFSSRSPIISLSASCPSSFWYARLSAAYTLISPLTQSLCSCSFLLSAAVDLSLLPACRPSSLRFSPSFSFLLRVKFDPPPTRRTTLLLVPVGRWPTGLPARGSPPPPPPQQSKSGPPGIWGRHKKEKKDAFQRL